MLLREMWSPIGSPKEDDENVDWLDDLKFFIDNDDTMLNQYFFPAVKKHKEHIGNPNAYKIYVRPIEKCLRHYCDKFKIEAPEEKFPKEKLIDLAKKIATEQEKFLERGDYENK
jgi:hypothetical protein